MPLSAIVRAAESQSLVINFKAEENERFRRHRRPKLNDRGLSREGKQEENVSQVNISIYAVAIED